MSGPKVLSAEEIKMRQEAEERYRLIQDQFRLCESLRRQIASYEDIGFLLYPINSMPESKEINDQLPDIIRRSKEELLLCDNPTGSDNVYYRQRVDTLQKLVEKNQKLIQKLKSQAEGLKKQHVDEMFNKINEDAASRESEASYGEVYVRQDIPMEFLQAEVSRLRQLLNHIEERAKRIGYPISGEYESITTALKDSISDRDRKLYMIYDELHRTELFKIQPLLSQVEQAEKAYDRLDAVLSNELATYHTLCREHNITPQQFSFAESSIDEIRYASAAILNEYGSEVDYTETMQRIRAILSQMGYSYLGEKEEDRCVSRQIFRIHDQTILHVIYDSTGRVTMEVAIEDNCDREPQPREVESLVTEQGAFCNSFERILRGIAQDGLHLQKETMYPVSADFAQIINTSDFKKVPAETAASDYSMFATPALKYKEMS